tara:strand:- start:294 stop:704 length:411 start_codon:yes stop_codon:yes gene_type:complete
MSKKKKVREFELKIGLKINENNYEELLRVYDQAVKTKNKRFPFRNEEGKLYAIDTDYVTFVLDYLDKADHEELEKQSDEYKKLEKKLTKEEFEKKQKDLLKKHEEDEKARNAHQKIYTMDGLIANKLKTKDIKKKK